MKDEASYRSLRKRVDRIAPEHADTSSADARRQLVGLRQTFDRDRSDLQRQTAAQKNQGRNPEADGNLLIDFCAEAPMAHLILNDEMVIEWANSAACRLLAREGERLSGKAFVALIAPEDQERFLRTMRKPAAQHHINSFDVQLGNRSEPADALVYLHIQAIVQREQGDQPRYWQLACIDITEHRRREAELMQTKTHLQMAARAARLGIWNADLLKGTSKWDKGLYRLLGLEPREGPESANYFFEFIHPDDRSGILRNIETIIDKPDNEIREEFRVVRADGKIRWLASRGWIFRDNQGRPHHIAGVNFDVSDRKKAEDNVRLTQLQLSRQLSDTERANEELSQYAYAVSHDLKGPLRAIRNYADFLYEDLAETLSGEQKRYLEGMKQAVQQGDDLIDDLLSLSRIDKMTLDKEKVDMPGIVNEIRSFLGPADDLEIDVEPSWPDVHVDHMVLKQILQNLIANAAKFNRSDPRRIHVGWQPAQEEAIEISVRDNGIGIAPQYHEQIFHIFQRLHTQDEFDGTGIGLAIVRKAAHKLGGSVRLESVPEQGSTFYVRLPR